MCSTAFGGRPRRTQQRTATCAEQTSKQRSGTMNRASIHDQFTQKFNTTGIKADSSGNGQTRTLHAAHGCHADGCYLGIYTKLFAACEAPVQFTYRQGVLDTVLLAVHSFVGMLPDIRAPAGGRPTRLSPFSLALQNACNDSALNCGRNCLQTTQSQLCTF